MYKVVIVEDEYYAQRVLINLLKKYQSTLEIVCIASDIDEAQKKIILHEPDFIFLDIKLPGGNGFDIIDFIKDSKIHIIFTTAFEEFTVKAFEASAVDYLLKPIIPERLNLALEKMFPQLDFSQSQTNLLGLKTNLDTQNITTITVKYKDSFKIIKVSDIIYFKAEGSYTIIKTTDSEFLQSHKLNHYENIFQYSKQIFRVHRSWMINIQNVTSFSKQKRIVKVLDIQIPVSKRICKTIFDLLQ